MTHREAFDKAKAHLLAQNAKAEIPNPRPDYGPSTVCAYRTSDGKKCAIGALIPNEEYKPEFESKSVVAIINEWDPPCLQGLKMDFLESLQSVHDFWGPNYWETRLREFEEDWAPVLE